MDNVQINIKKFEQMLKSDKVYFFDSIDFEDIISYYLETGEINKAKKAMQLGLQQHPLDIELLLLKAEILTIDDKLDEALVVLKQAKQNNRYNVDVLLQTAMIYSLKNDHNSAIKILQKAGSFYIDSFDDMMDIVLQLMKEYIFIEDYEGACVYFRTLIDNDVEYQNIIYNQEFLHDFVFCINATEKYTTTIEYLSKYLDVNPYDNLAWYYLGLVYEHLELYGQAFSAFDYAIVCDDDFIEAYLRKASVLEKNHEYKKALEVYSILSVEKDYSDESLLLGMGRCYKGLKEFDMALELLEGINEQDVFFDKVLYEISDIYLTKGELTNAILYIKKAIELNCEDDKYLDMLKTIATDDRLTKKEKTIISSIDIDIIKIKDKVKKEILAIETFLDTRELDNANEKIKDLSDIRAMCKDAEYIECYVHYYNAILLLFQGEESKAIKDLDVAISINKKRFSYFKRKYPEVLNDKISTKLKAFLSIHGLN